MSLSAYLSPTRDSTHLDTHIHTHTAQHSRAVQCLHQRREIVARMCWGAETENERNHWEAAHHPMQWPYQQGQFARHWAAAAPHTCMHTYMYTHAHHACTSNAQTQTQPQTYNPHTANAAHRRRPPTKATEIAAVQRSRESLSPHRGQAAQPLSPAAPPDFSGPWPRARVGVALRACGVWCVCKETPPPPRPDASPTMRKFSVTRVHPINRPGDRLARAKARSHFSVCCRGVSFLFVCVCICVCVFGSRREGLCVWHRSSQSFLSRPPHTHTHASMSWLGRGKKKSPARAPAAPAAGGGAKKGDPAKLGKLFDSYAGAFRWPRLVVSSSLPSPSLFSPASLSTLASLLLVFACFSCCVDAMHPLRLCVHTRRLSRR